jgi:hypothetical protein
MVALRRTVTWYARVRGCRRGRGPRRRRRDRRGELVSALEVGMEGAPRLHREKFVVAIKSKPARLVAERTNQIHDAPASFAFEQTLN